MITWFFKQDRRKISSGSILSCIKPESFTSNQSSQLPQYPDTTEKLQSPKSHCRHDSMKSLVQMPLNATHSVGAIVEMQWKCTGMHFSNITSARSKTPTILKKPQPVK